MGFQYNRNEEVLSQYHATYLYDQTSDEIHWMTDGRHYRVDFVTFSRILGFGEEHRGYTYIHDEPRAKICDISYMWRDRRIADGKRSVYKASIISSTTSSGTPSTQRME